jgi:exodeoxyribonuclease VII small subunit
MNDKQFDFEKMMEELENIVKQMESKTISLADSVALYEQGSKIIKQLEKALAEAEKKIEKLVTITEPNVQD